MFGSRSQTPRRRAASAAREATVEFGRYDTGQARALQTGCSSPHVATAISFGAGVSTGST